MRNGQLKPDIMFVCCQQRFHNRHWRIQQQNRLRHADSVLTYLWHKHGKSYRNVVADSGYESLANYRWLFENGQTAFIKPANYESGKKRSSKSQVGRMENMGYYEPDDCFICKNGRHLDLSSHIPPMRRTVQSAKSLFTAARTAPTALTVQPAARLKTAKGSKIFVCWEFQNLRNNSYHNITTEEGKLLRCNRSIQAEGAFRTAKAQSEFQAFPYRRQGQSSG